MSESDIIQRLQKATLYAGHGELSDLPEEAADTITALRAKVERLEADLVTARADALEEAARCAEKTFGEGYHIASAIRALATK